jgi:hypothetical protein
MSLQPGIVQMSGKDLAQAVGLLVARGFCALLNLDLEDLEAGATSKEKLIESLPRRETLFSRLSEFPEALTIYQVKEKFNAYKAFLDSDEEMV